MLDETVFIDNIRPSAEELLQRIRPTLEEYWTEELPVLVAGSGLGASVALDLALVAPGRIRGALLYNGVPHRASATEQARAGSALGLEVELVLAEGVSLHLSPNRVDRQLGQAFAFWLAESCQLNARVIVCEEAGTAAALEAALERLLTD